MLTGIIFLLWGMIHQQNIFAEAQIEIKVAKHIVKGSGVTAAQMESWVAAMNTDWACSFKFVQVGAPDTVDNVGDGKAAGAINIYGSARTATSPGNPGLCVDENYIEMGQGCPPSSASHEFGHWMGAKPDSTTTDHGTPVGKYPDYPGYTGYDTNGDGVRMIKTGKILCIRVWEGQGQKRMTFSSFTQSRLPLYGKTIMSL